MISTKINKKRKNISSRRRGKPTSIQHPNPMAKTLNEREKIIGQHLKTDFCLLSFTMAMT